LGFFIYDYPQSRLKLLSREWVYYVISIKKCDFIFGYFYYFLYHCKKWYGMNFSKHIRFILKLFSVVYSGERVLSLQAGMMLTLA